MALCAVLGMFRPAIRLFPSPAALAEARPEDFDMPQARAKNIALTAESAPDLPAVSVDPDRIAQVLDNLLSNALRYTPENGRISLSAMPNHEGIRMTIQDSGPGMTSDELSHIFDRFYRGDKSRQRYEGSSGLGLSIARSIVQGHNGRISAHSQPGQGMTFTITLPTVE